MRILKIVIDLTSLADNFSGIERYAFCIAYELIQHKDYEYVLVFKEKVFPAFENMAERDNITYVVLKRCRKLLFNQIRLPNALRKMDADIFLFLAFPIPVLFFGKNAVTTIHDIGCWDCPETMKFLSKWYFRISHRIAMCKKLVVITISDFSKKRIMERLRYPEDRIWTIYAGIDDAFTKFREDAFKKHHVRDEYHLPEKYLLTLSTLEPRKNIKLLLEAYTELILQGSIDIPLVAVGRRGWKIDSLFEDIPEVVKKNIYFTGFVQEDCLPYIYSGADFFVFPSKYEGFGLPPLEAAAYGAPVLSSDAASLPEVMGDTAVYFKSGDKEDLKKKILLMVRLTDEERRRMKEKGKQQVLKYSWKKEAEKLYQKLGEQADRIAVKGI